MNLLKEGDSYRFIKLKGLEPDSYYYNSYDNGTYKGEYYEKVGLNFTRDWFDEFKCLLITINKVNK